MKLRLIIVIRIAIPKHCAWNEWIWPNRERDRPFKMALEKKNITKYTYMRYHFIRSRFTLLFRLARTINNFITSHTKFLNNISWRKNATANEWIDKDTYIYMESGRGGPWTKRTSREKKREKRTEIPCWWYSSFDFDKNKKKSFFNRNML